MSAGECLLFVIHGKNFRGNGIENGLRRKTAGRKRHWCRVVIDASDRIENGKTGRVSTTPRNTTDLVP
jgi:hypothetical protein